MRTFRIAVIAGDGIGPEVMEPCLELLDAVAARVGGFTLAFEHLEAGAALYLRTGDALPAVVLERSGAADAILLGALGLPDVRYPNGTEIVPQIDLREHFNLYAGVRPIFVLSGLPTPLADARAREIDCVLLRESTEGLFSARKLSRSEGTPGSPGETVYDTLQVTRHPSERLFTCAFDLARRRRREGRTPRVTCVDKANVLPSMAFFRDIFAAVARRYPDVIADAAYVDATALRLVRAPWEFDVLVTENMFGDILSDLGAALMGGMGMAPSADIGDAHAVFQPCHGTAPDIAGRGAANPTAMMLSGAMMLEWLGDRHGVVPCGRAAAALRRAVNQAFEAGDLVPRELGGASGTVDIASRIRQALDTTPID